MTDDIVAFIRARLDEDEAMARVTTPVPVFGEWKAAQAKHPRSEDEPISIVQGRDEHQPDYEGYSSGNPVIVTGAGWPDEPDNEANLRHIARHDPARVLRGVEAKRRMIDEIFRYEECIDGEWGCCHEAEAIAAGECKRNNRRIIPALKIIASEWSDHADYREGWKP